jgi:hypothetical protein
VNLDETKIPKVNEIQECLEDADKHLRLVLRHTPTKKSG